MLSSRRKNSGFKKEMHRYPEKSDTTMPGPVLKIGSVCGGEGDAVFIGIGRKSGNFKWH